MIEALKSGLAHKGSTDTGQVRLNHIICWSLIALLIFVFYFSAIYFQLLDVDSAYYVHNAGLLMEGELLYVDVIDNKGPLLYFLNISGLYLFDSIYGPYVIEGVFLALGVFIYLFVLHRHLNPVVSSIFVLGFLSSYFVTLKAGNYTESWQTPFTLVAYGLFLRFLFRKDSHGQKEAPDMALLFAVALAIIVSLLIRPNNAAGSWIILIYLLFFERRPWRTFAVCGSVIIVPVAFITTLFTLKGIFGGFLKEYILWGTSYSLEADLAHRVNALHMNLRHLLHAPITVAAIALTLTHLLGSKVRSTDRELNGLLVLVVIFAADFFSQHISGQGFGHYWALQFASLLMICCYVSVSWARKHSHLYIELLERFGRNRKVMLPLLVLVLVIYNAEFVQYARLTGLTNEASFSSKLVRFVQQNSDEDDVVVVRAYFPRIYAHTNRKSHKSSYSYNLMAPSRAPELQDDLNDLLHSSPKLIIEKAIDCGVIKPCPLEEVNPTVAELRELLKERYSEPIWIVENEVYGVLRLD